MAEPDADTATPAPDPDRLRRNERARLDYLLDAGLLAVTDEEEVTPTEEFEDTRAIYADSYKDADDDSFHETVAELFGIPREEAADRVAELDLTRWEVATYLAVRSDLEDRGVELPQDVLLELAAILAAAGEASAVPPKMQTLPDDFERFLEHQGDAVVFVYARECDPCRSMKSELDEMYDRLPDGVTVAGADGEDAPDLRRAYEVEVAPTTLVFVDGVLHEKLEGYKDPDALGETFAGAYSP